VLQRRDAGGVLFSPTLPEKESAIDSLSMGPVVKLVLEFRKTFWPVRDFGFVHALGEPIPTWWSNKGRPIVTAWAGGPRAAELSRLGPDELKQLALSMLAEMFDQELAKVRDLLVAVHQHDWVNDPFSRGAYSYTPEGMMGRADELAAPVEDTLFFAGEATDSTGEQGTVHAALASGRRAARQMLEALRRDRKVGTRQALASTEKHHLV
jgi:monoamine oxidase